MYDWITWNRYKTAKIGRNSLIMNIIINPDNEMFSDIMTSFMSLFHYSFHISQYYVSTFCLRSGAFLLYTRYIVVFVSPILQNMVMIVDTNISKMESMNFLNSWFCWINHCECGVRWRIKGIMIIENLLSPHLMAFHIEKKVSQQWSMKKPYSQFI